MYKRKRAYVGLIEYPTSTLNLLTTMTLMSKALGGPISSPPVLPSKTQTRVIHTLDLSTGNEEKVQRTRENLFTILSSLSRLSIPDRARFALFGTSSIQSAPPGCIHHVFSRRAMTLPNNIAAEYMGESITYRELDRLSDVLANTLKTCSIGPGQRVCLLMRRSITMLIGILGVLKSGASYVPLDGGVVTENSLLFILRDSAVSAILYMDVYRARVPDGTISFCLESITSNDSCTSSRSLSKLHDVSTSSDEAYVIYTSGTTGTPKGVSVRHDNVTNLLCMKPGSLNIQPGTRVSQILNVAFDMCVWEVLGCLLNGGTLCIRGRDREHWTSTLRTVDVVICTPTILQAYNPVEFSFVRCIATAGEPCPQGLADSWSRRVKFYNACGPTETTIVNTMMAHVAGKPVTIGHPTPNNSVYILDSDRLPLPVGKIGVLWAAGAGVSSGYVNRPDLTAERYVPDPFTGTGLMFNTGDLGRWTTNGEIEHHGRIDDQVKVKGFRVELDGIAAVIEKIPGVLKAVALQVEHKLYGVVYPHCVDAETVKSFVMQHLPYYSVPSHYLMVDNLPTTSNGKVDKLTLICAVRKHQNNSSKQGESPTSPSIQVECGALVLQSYTTTV